MSMGSSWQRFSVASPPERGAFPLDLQGECKSFLKPYLDCLKEGKGNNTMCKELSKAYLKCRMDRGLMESDRFTNLGFDNNEVSEKK